MASIAVVVLAAIVSGTSLISAAGAAAVPSSRPIQVEIVRAPDNGSDWDLAIATWALALGTIGLCLITGIGVRKQGKDMQRSVEAAEASAAAASKSASAAADAVEAAARQRREDLERAVNSAAHRVMATGARVHELAREVPGAAKTLFALAGRDVASNAAPYERVMKLRQETANDAVTAGGILLGTLERKPADSELTDGLRDMDRRLVAVELMKEDVTRQLESLNSQIEFQREQNNAQQRAERGGRPSVFPPS